MEVYGILASILLHFVLDFSYHFLTCSEFIQDYSSQQNNSVVAKVHHTQLKAHYLPNIKIIGMHVRRVQ